MWTATRRQNLDRVNIFKPIKPSVFHTTTEKPWCVWLPGGDQRDDCNNGWAGQAYRVPTFTGAQWLVDYAFMIQRSFGGRRRCDVFQAVARVLNFVGAEPC